VDPIPDPAVEDYSKLKYTRPPTPSGANEGVEERTDPVFVDFGDEIKISGTEEPKATQSEKATAANQLELLKLHHRLGHISIHRIRAMAKLGLAPKQLAVTPVPMCASCQFGKATRRPWRTKALPRQAAKMVDIKAPGDCVSIDQLESPTVGFLGQVKGKLTTKRYQVATIFVDHYTRYGYIYLQHSTNSQETLQAKRSFEAHC